MRLGKYLAKAPSEPARNAVIDAIWCRVPAPCRRDIDGLIKLQVIRPVWDQIWDAAWDRIWAQLRRKDFQPPRRTTSGGAK